MEFFDSHTHIPDDISSEALEAILSDSRAAGVSEMLFAGTSMRDIPQYLSFAAAHPGVVHTSVGVHPEACGEFDVERDLPILREWLKAPGVVAVGEIGMDAFYDATSLETQETCLRAMLNLAVEAGLPVILHCREAFEKCHPILEECLPLEHPLLVHSFADGPKELELWLKRNTVFSYNGMTTFKKAENIRETLRLIPLERLLLETDAPYLTPVPFRGQPNSSKYIPIIAQRIADERGVSLEDIARITTDNAKHFFRV